MRLLDRITNNVLNLFFNLFEPKLKPIEPPTPQLVAKRFRQLFIEHGVEETRIPRIFPKISLEDLQSDHLLIKKLTPELINEVAELFKVRSEWLDGVDDLIYSHQSCYKHPEKFFTFLNSIKYDNWEYPFRIITPIDKFDYKNESRQPFSIIYFEKIAELGEDNIYRYYLDTGWSWGHFPCRIQIKAMALLYWKKVRYPITIYKIPREIYYEIEEHQQFPFSSASGSLLSEPSLEDYILDLSESRVSNESDELPKVVKYIEDNNLLDIKLYRSTVNNNVELELEPFETKINEHSTLDINSFEINLEENSSGSFKQAISEMNSKAAKARYEPLDKIKSEFKEFLIKKSYQNKSQAARDFFNSLNVDDKKLIVKSYYEKDHKNGEIKAVRNLTNSLK